MRVLMVGVDRQTKGGMWTVAENYLQSANFCECCHLKYISTSITGTISRRLLFTAKALIAILKELGLQHYDIVHVHMAERGSVYRKNLVICLARLFRCKVVLHMHGAEFEEWYNHQTEAGQRRIRRILDRADIILILGKYWESFIGSLVQDKKKIAVLYNAVSVPEENPYNCEAKNILFLGAVCQRKGIHDLLQAVKMAEPELPADTKVLLHGPDCEHQIETAILQMELSDKVEYRGWLDKEQKPAVFQKTAINVLPSYHEGLPMTILETMAFGIPNISTAVAAIPEAVEESNGALIVPGDIAALSKEMLRLLTDDEARKRKSEKAYDRVKSVFSLQTHFEQVLKIYRELSEENA